MLHLLALGSMKHHQAVALSAFGRSSQFPQPVRVRCFGHLSVPERSGGTRRLHDHLTQTWRNPEKSVKATVQRKQCLLNYCWMNFQLFFISFSYLYSNICPAVLQVWNRSVFAVEC